MKQVTVTKKIKGNKNANMVSWFSKEHIYGP